MDFDLLKKPTDELLKKFGIGSHKPGSGSAAAFNGMLSAQLIRTVVSLSNDPKRRASFGKHLAILLDIQSEIDTKIYPDLERLFYKDSQLFDKAIRLREARDKETDREKKDQLKVEALEALKPATEVLFEIAQNCIRLVDSAAYTFDFGFQSARGDSVVAMTSAIGAVAGCLSIADLNLLSFGVDIWVDTATQKRDKLRLDHSNWSQEVTIRIEKLKEEADANREYHFQLKEIQNGLGKGVKATYSEIEALAMRLQDFLWTHRKRIWKASTPTSFIDSLSCQTVFTKILQYKFDSVLDLGQDEIDDEHVEVAGLIDTQNKVVSVSERFSEHERNFTTAHELGHALLHQDAMLTLHRDRPLSYSNQRTSKTPIEDQADKFATFFLMPRNEIEEAFQQRFLTKRLVIDEDTIYKLRGGSLTTFFQKYNTPAKLANFLAKADLYQGAAFKPLNEAFRVSVSAMGWRLRELALFEVPLGFNK